MTKQRRYSYGKGNIDLYDRPQVKTPEGVATVKSRSFNIDGKETLIPTVSHEGTIMSDEEALRYYKKRREYLGKFDTVKEADDYAEKLHIDQMRLYSPREKD